MAGIFDATASALMTVTSILLIVATTGVRCRCRVRLIALFLVVNMLVMLTNAAFLVRCVFVTTSAGIVYVVEMFFSLSKILFSHKIFDANKLSNS